MVKVVLGILLALAVGAGCRWLDLPVPAPPKLLGVLLIMAITLGYMGADRLLSGRGQDSTGVLEASEGRGRTSD